MLPAVEERFIARGRVVRAGKRQIFAGADLSAVRGDNTILVATGETILMPVDA
jgi:acyl-coenzyme A thioesterase PaaI-like protein